MSHSDGESRDHGAEPMKRMQCCQIVSEELSYNYCRFIARLGRLAILTKSVMQAYGRAACSLQSERVSEIARDNGHAVTLHTCASCAVLSCATWLLQ